MAINTQINDHVATYPEAMKEFTLLARDTATILLAKSTSTNVLLTRGLDEHRIRSWKIEQHNRRIKTL